LFLIKTGQASFLRKHLEVILPGAQKIFFGLGRNFSLEEVFTEDEFEIGLKMHVNF
jgi:hypothetical protein